MIKRDARAGHTKLQKSFGGRCPVADRVLAREYCRMVPILTHVVGDQ